MQPRARRNEIVGWRGEALLVRVSAPPLDGRANAAVCALVAERLGVRQAAVSVVRGARGRDKLLEIEGVDPQRVRALAG